MVFRKLVALRVYTGEDILCGEVPLYKAVIREAVKQGIAGGTVLKAVAGYASTKRGFAVRASKFISGNVDSPMVIEMIDKKENIEKMLPFLEKNVTHGLVVVGEVDCLETDYMRKKEKELAELEKAEEKNNIKK